MQLRRLGRTDLQVSEIDFGAWGIGGTMWIGATQDDSMKALHTAKPRLATAKPAMPPAPAKKAEPKRRGT